jgi:hypothetical protein
MFAKGNREAAAENEYRRGRKRFQQLENARIAEQKRKNNEQRRLFQEQQIRSEEMHRMEEEATAQRAAEENARTAAALENDRQEAELRNALEAHKRLQEEKANAIQNEINRLRGERHYADANNKLKINNQVQEKVAELQLYRPTYTMRRGGKRRNRTRR